MAIVAKNQHRWRKCPPPEITKVLNKYAKSLSWAWDHDRKYPKDFPINTWWVFVQLEDQLKDDGKPKPKARLPKPTVPKTFAEFIPENTLKAAYEDHYEGSFNDALKLAGKGFNEGYRAWRKIQHALKITYLICYQAIDSAPMPRVHFLHRRLLLISECEHLHGLTKEALVDFFDDLCPCGKSHSAEAIRKLRKRTPNLKEARFKRVM